MKTGRHVFEKMRRANTEAASVRQTSNLHSHQVKGTSSGINPKIFYVRVEIGYICRDLKVSQMGLYSKNHRK